MSIDFNHFHQKDFNGSFNFQESKLHTFNVYQFTFLNNYVHKIKKCEGCFNLILNQLISKSEFLSKVICEEISLCDTCKIINISNVNAFICFYLIKNICNQEEIDNKFDIVRFFFDKGINKNLGYSKDKVFIFHYNDELFEPTDVYAKEIIVTATENNTFLAKIIFDNESKITSNKFIIRKNLNRIVVSCLGSNLKAQLDEPFAYIEDSVLLRAIYAFHINVVDNYVDINHTYNNEGIIFHVDPKIRVKKCYIIEDDNSFNMELDKIDTKE